METDSSFRIGPVLHSGFAFGGLQLDEQHIGDRQYYSFELRGESPDHGFSRIYVRAIGLYELLELPQLNVELSEAVPEAPIQHTTRFHHQLVSLGFESPLFYELTSPLNLEFGWVGGFTLAQVKFRDPQQPTNIGPLIGDFAEVQPTRLGAQQKQNPAQQDAQFAGGELGGYTRYYQFYPLVPYASARLHLGSFFDTDAFINGVEQSPNPLSNRNTQNTSNQNETPTFQRVYQSAFTPGAMGSLGLEFYFGSRSLIGLEYSLWNWNWYRPQDWTHFVSFKGGFLF